MMASRYRGREVVPDWRWQPPMPQHTRILSPSRRSLNNVHRAKSNHLDDNKRERPYTIDVIGGGKETTICGHIDLLCLLPLHNSMHRELLETFRKKPGNYEGKYKAGGKSKASVVDYGNGYLAIHFTDDITRPEMSEFLLKRDWRLLNAHCTVQDGKDVIYEKWTNVLDSKTPQVGNSRRLRARSVPRRYY